MNREPAVIIGTITAAATAVLALVVAFGLEVTDDQQSAILAVVAILAPLVATIVTRGRVTPVASPEANDGTPLVKAE